MSEQVEVPDTTPPPGCDEFAVWKTEGRYRFMRCACGATATAFSDSDEHENRSTHYKRADEMARADGGRD